MVRSLSRPCVSGWKNILAANFWDWLAGPVSQTADRLQMERVDFLFFRDARFTRPQDEEI